MNPLKFEEITDTLGGVSELLWGLAESAEGSEITPHSLVILARLVEGVQGDLNALIDANRPQKATNRRNTAASQSR